MTQGFKAAAVILMVAFIAVPAFAQAPGDLYKAKCAMCHGADGLATSAMAKNMKVLSFKDPAMLKATDVRFFASTKNGLNKMPAYNGKLTDQQIKDVIAYIRKLQK
jgi:mono/diheme cytochrome c family protein